MHQREKAVLDELSWVVRDLRKRIAMEHEQGHTYQAEVLAAVLPRMEEYWRNMEAMPETQPASTTLP